MTGTEALTASLAPGLPHEMSPLTKVSEAQPSADKITIKIKKARFIMFGVKAGETVLSPSVF